VGPNSDGIEHEECPSMESVSCSCLFVGHRFFESFVEMVGCPVCSISHLSISLLDLYVDSGPDSTETTAINVYHHFMFTKKCAY
jgi:hypothetical protein